MTHRWIPKEDVYVKASYMTLSRKQMAKHLKVTVDILSAHMTRIKIRRYKPWNEEEDAYILKNYKRCTCVEMAKYLDRTPSILRTHLWSMGLRRFNKKAGHPTPAPQIDLMHRSEYDPEPWEYARDGAGDASLLPSGAYQPAARYRDAGHP